MSDKEWYEGVKDELAGKHVHVVFKTGIVMDGRLEWDGFIYVSPNRQTSVLVPAKGGSWELSSGVDSVSLVWDERDWEQIGLDEVDRFAKDAYAIVINGHLHVIDWYSEDTCCFDLAGTDGTVDAGDLSFALRRRNMLPAKPYHRDPPAPCTEPRTTMPKSSRPCPRTRGSDDPQARAEAMSGRTYKLSDQNWQHPAFDTIYRWIMNRWDDLHTRYEQETKDYDWIARPKQWRNAAGRNMGRILSDYPDTITQPLGRIFYSTAARDRTRNTIKKTETAIAHQDGTCTITDSRIHIALAEAGTTDIHLSEAGPYRLPRIVVTVRKGR